MYFVFFAFLRWPCFTAAKEAESCRWRKRIQERKGWMDWKDGMGVMMIVECQLSCCYFADVWCLVVMYGVFGL